MPPHPTLFDDIDSMVPEAFAKHLSEEVSFVFGNSEPVIGRENVRETWANFCAAIHGVSHAVVEQWVSGPVTIAEALVTYTRKDDSTVSLPVVTIYRGEGDLIEDYRIFMDVNPLFDES
jgi:limonene-1,2-epoxide hydrolase